MPSSGTEGTRTFKTHWGGMPGSGSSFHSARTTTGVPRASWRGCIFPVLGSSKAVGSLNCSAMDFFSTRRDPKVTALPKEAGITKLLLALAPSNGSAACCVNTPRRTKSTSCPAFSGFGFRTSDRTAARRRSSRIKRFA